LGHTVVEAQTLVPHTRPHRPSSTELSSDYSIQELEEGFAEYRVADVRAPGFVHALANVRDTTGEPLSGVQVTFTWTSGSESYSESHRTNWRGRASALRWTSSGVEGQPMVLTITARDAGWSTTSYAWYVPE
jgi:hypothetical protein